MAAEKCIYLQFFSPFCQPDHNASFGWLYNDGAAVVGLLPAYILAQSTQSWRYDQVGKKGKRIGDKCIFLQQKWTASHYFLMTLLTR